jgi:peptidyl-prolyl cis-trans isomerase C
MPFRKPDIRHITLLAIILAGFAVVSVFFVGEPAKFGLYKKGELMARARARHILVDSKEECEELKERIEAGEDFGDIARQYSKCPSSKEGGDLGEFGRGEMVPEFDRVVFTAEVKKVQGPVKTAFGYHLVEVTSREE